MYNSRFAVVVAVIVSTLGWAFSTASAATLSLVQPPGTKVIASTVPLSRTFLQKIIKKPMSALIFRKSVVQKTILLHTGALTGGAASGGTGGGGTGSTNGGSPSTVSAIVSPTTTIAVNSFGGDDTVTLAAEYPQEFSNNDCLFAADPNLNLSSTQFDQSGPLILVGITANEMSQNTMFMVDFTVQLSSPASTNYIAMYGSVPTIMSFGSPTFSQIPANSSAVYGSSQTQEVVVIVQGNYSLVALQCPAGWNFISAEVTPIQ